MNQADVVILGLRLLLVALLYGFMLLVLKLAGSMLSPANDVEQAMRTEPGERGRAPAARDLSAPANGPLRLAVVDGGQTGWPAGQVLSVAVDATVGRSQSADLVVPDPTVSNAHVRLKRARGGWCVQDLGSTNGTRLGSRELTRDGGEAPLRQGDLLELGGVRLQVQ